MKISEPAFSAVARKLGGGGAPMKTVLEIISEIDKRLSQMNNSFWYAETSQLKSLKSFILNSALIDETCTHKHSEKVTVCIECKKPWELCS